MERHKYFPPSSAPNSFLSSILKRQLGNLGQTINWFLYFGRYETLYRQKEIGLVIIVLSLSASAIIIFILIIFF